MNFFKVAISVNHIIEKFIWLVVFLFLIFSRPSSSLAQFFEGPVASGVGGAGRASVDPLEGAFLNPASLSQLNSYYMGISYQDSSNVSTGNERGLNITVADSTPDKILPAALSYTTKRTTGDGQATIDQKDFYIAIADYVVSRLSMGIGFHHLKTELVGQSLSENNFHLGFLFTPTEEIGLALVLYDFIGSGSDIPTNVQLKRSVALGSTFVVKEFLRVRFDAQMDLEENPENKVKLMGGFESALHKFFTLRFGGQWNALGAGFNRGIKGSSFASVGMTFTGPKLQLDYSLQKELGDGSGQRHMFDLRLSF